MSLKVRNRTLLMAMTLILRYTPTKIKFCLDKGSLGKSLLSHTSLFRIDSVPNLVQNLPARNSNSNQKEKTFFEQSNLK